MPSWGLLIHFPETTRSRLWTILGNLQSVSSFLSVPGTASSLNTRLRMNCEWRHVWCEFLQPRSVGGGLGLCAEGLDWGQRGRRDAIVWCELPARATRKALYNFTAACLATVCVSYTFICLVWMVVVSSLFWGGGWVFFHWSYQTYLRLQLFFKVFFLVSLAFTSEGLWLSDALCKRIYVWV